MGFRSPIPKLPLLSLACQYGFVRRRGHAGNFTGTRVLENHNRWTSPLHDDFDTDQSRHRLSYTCFVEFAISEDDTSRLCNSLSDSDNDSVYAHVFLQNIQSTNVGNHLASKNVLWVVGWPESLMLSL